MNEEYTKKRVVKNMEKEKLTKELILEDIRYSQKNCAPLKSLKKFNLIFYGSFLAAFWILAITKSAYALFLLLIPVGYDLIVFMIQRKNLKQLSEKSISVSTGKLEFVREEVVDVGGKHGRYKTRILLSFGGDGEWEIPNVNYTWSKTYSMSRKGIDNTSLQGDLFYLARLNENGEIAVAYNQKFFDYQEA